MNSKKLVLGDGSTIGYDDLGPGEGFPVLFFHGTPASRVNFRFFSADDHLERLGLRVFALDRPGIGSSSPRVHRRLTHWPEQVCELLDRLEISRAAVVAHSGGGPYALACAALTPERVAAVSLVAGSPPDYSSGEVEGTNADSQRFLELSARRPRMAKTMLATMKLMLNVAPRAFARQAAKVLPEADKRLVDDSAGIEAFIAMMRETLRQGPAGAQIDGALMYGPWDLPLDRIEAPVRLWYGDEDRNVPVSVGRYFQERIPGSELFVCPGEGHLSIMANQAGRILEDLALAAGAGTDQPWGFTPPRAA